MDRVTSLEEHFNGHVARNARLSLMLLDLVEPYVEWGPLLGEKVLLAGFPRDVMRVLASPIVRPT